MKSIRNDKYVKQWLCRQYLLKPLWKSKAEFYKHFEQLRNVKLLENSWIFHDECKEYISQECNIQIEDIWIEQATPKYKGKFANKVWIYVNDSIVQYETLFVKDIQSYEPPQNEFFFIYVPKNVDSNSVIAKLREKCVQYFFVRP